MSVLIIDEETKARIKVVLDYAKEHPYHPTSDFTPGDDHHFVANLNSYRCVFTYTHIRNEVYRHLSMSVKRKGKYPHTYAACSIAELFGFTGWDGEPPVDRLPSGWMVTVNENDNCITMAQLVGEDKLQ